MNPAVKSKLIRTIIPVIVFLGMVGSTLGQNPLPERCTDAIHVCGAALDGFTVQLPDTNSTLIIWPEKYIPGVPSSGNISVCGTTGGTFNNTIWLSFLTCAPKVHIRIHFLNCVHPMNNLADTGIQTGLYSKCKHTASVACADMTGSLSGFVDLVYDMFTPGELAFIVIDGYSATVCDIRIEVIEGIDTTPAMKPDTTVMTPGSITGPNSLGCYDQGLPIKYNLTKPECAILYPPACTSNDPNSPNGLDSIKYVWSVSPTLGRYFVGNDSFGLDNEIVFTDNGKYTISVAPVFDKEYGGVCDNAGCAEIYSWDVDVFEADTTYMPLVEICPSTPYTYCNVNITSDTIIYCLGQGCQVTAQPFKVGSYVTTIMGEKFVCPGNNFQFQGVNYGPGDFLVNDVVDCNVRYQFSVTEIVLTSSINAIDYVLTCKQTSIDLKGIFTSNGNNIVNYKWLNTQNQILGLGSNLSISTPGTYVLEVSYEIDPNQICRMSSSALITQDIEKPKVIASIPTVKCRDKVQTPQSLSLTSNLPLILQTWKTPSGTQVNGASVQVDSINASLGIAYTFHGEASNGCIVDTSFFIPTNFATPNLSIDGNKLTCTDPFSTLRLISNMTLDTSSISWLFNDGSMPVFICCDDQFVTSPQNKAGTYMVRARAASSQCYNNGSKLISEDKGKPNIELGQDMKWYCNSKPFVFLPELLDQGPNLTYKWSATKGGTISGNLSGSQAMIDGPGTYYLKVLNSINGCQRTDSFKIVTETNVPTFIDVFAEDITCFGDRNGTIKVNGHTGGVGPFKYFINGLSIDTLNPKKGLQSGKYTIEVVDDHECRISTFVDIIEPPLLSIDVDPMIQLDYLEERRLDFESSYAFSDLSEIFWFSKDGKVLGNQETLDYVGNQNDELTLVVKNSNGCETRTNINVIVQNELEIYYPNIFSPNGDGINDRLSISKNRIPVTPKSFQVFDRSGNQVYNQQGIDFNEKDAGWDGYFNGKRVEQGVYIVKLSYIDFNQLVQTKVFDVFVTF